MSSALDARYGRTPERRRAARWWAVIVAVGVALVVILWVVWVGLFAPTASIESRTTGFDVVSPGEVVVEYEVSVEPGRAVACAVESLNEKYAVVGWKVVEHPASDARTRSFTESLRTSEPAVNGLIYRCWLT